MMKKLMIISTVLFMVLNSCKEDDTEELIDFSVSFTSETISLQETDATKDISLSFSRAASDAGTITINYTVENATYGTDFTTTPAGDSGSLSVPVAIGDLSTTFSLTKILDPIEGTTKTVTFTISSFDQTDWINGSTTSALVSFTPIASLGAVIDVETGGSNEPNQVYIDLSTGKQTAVRRDIWEIAFYNGTENRVFLNSSLLVSAVELDGYTDIDAVSSTTTFTEPIALKVLNFSTYQSDDVSVTNMEELTAGLPVGYTQYGDLDEGISFTDSQTGNISETAFAEVSTTDEENNVYIVSLGSAIPTEAAELGKVNTTGDHRGFLKVRILSTTTGYTVQYAALDDTSFTEVAISKDDSKLLSAFSLSTGAEVDVEPAEEEWDLNISGVFSFYGFNYGIVAGLTYTDYALHNTLGNVGLYQVTTYETDDEGVVTNLEVPSYADFAATDVNESSLVTDNKAVIGSGWRNAFAGSLSDDRYYVLKDASGNFYKIKFTAFLSSEGERGYPQFVYERL